jgi:Aspartate-semialdehyde dehydrogenase
MLMGGYHIAVVGATGAAGTELLRVLERRSFPVASLRPIGSAVQREIRSILR